MKYILALLFLPVSLFAQQQQQQQQQPRIDRFTMLKQSVVKIFVDSEQTGTGFFVAPDGIVTTWNNVAPCFGTDSKGQTSMVKPISIEFADGARFPVDGMQGKILGDGLVDAVCHDYCMLIVTKVNHPISFLKIGRFEDIQEGAPIYTCGFPFGKDQIFTSSGILSTKFVDKHKLPSNTGHDTTILRDAALLDVTLNRGCIGAPILIAGQTPDDDEVIGVASFLDNVLEAQRARQRIQQMPPQDVPSFRMNDCLSINYIRDFIISIVTAQRAQPAAQQQPAGNSTGKHKQK